MWTVLEAYVKPTNNKVLTTYQLHCLKQEDLTFDEFKTKVKLRLAELNYPSDARDQILRDTLVFGRKSEKVQRVAIDKRDTLTLANVISLQIPKRQPRPRWRP